MRVLCLILNRSENEWRVRLREWSIVDSMAKAQFAVKSVADMPLGIIGLTYAIGFGERIDAREIRQGRRFRPRP